MNLQNKIAIITGGASGLGLATACLLKDKGAKVILLDINKPQLESVAKEHGMTPAVCDVTSVESVSSVIEAVVTQFGSIHVCINCAGVAPASRVVSKTGVMPLVDFEKVISINLVGSFNVLSKAAEQMLTQAAADESDEKGIIINTASVAAYDGQIGQAAYAASKGGVVSMTLPIARELARFGVRVMCIAPGIMQTPMLLSMPESVQQRLHASVPFPQRMGLPGEFASLACHIIENSYLNGEVIRLDGAIRMPAK